MARYFSDVVAGAKTGRRAVVRAVQAWQFLVSKASNRQLVRYDHVAEIMSYKDNRPLASILNFIMVYCSQYELPPLTGIVVNKDGTPGAGFTETPRDQLDRKREDVFGYDWYGIVPPSVDEFQTAYEISKRRKA